MRITVEPVRSIELSEIRAARERIANTIARTPLIRLELGAEFPDVRLKLENLQPINAYKLRGAANAVPLPSEPPEVVIAPIQPVTLPNTLTLTATVTDDGIPKPRSRRQQAVGQETPPTLKYSGEPSPVNVPLPSIAKPPRGLSLGWIVYRGPANVTFDPPGYVVAKEGKVVTTATFTEPGKYTLRAIASDGMLKVPTDVVVIVNRPGAR